MEMWDGGGPIDTGYDEPNSVSGKEYLKMSSNQRNDYHKKLFDSIEADVTTIHTKTIYTYEGVRYGSVMAMKTGYLIELNAKRKKIGEPALSDKEMKLALEKFDFKKVTEEIIGFKEATSISGKDLYVVTTSKYKQLNGKSYTSLDEIAAAMDAIDRNNDFENAILKGLGQAPWQGGSGKKKSNLAQYTKSEPTTPTQQYIVSEVEPLFYQKRVDDIKKLMAYIEEHKMHESVFDHNRVKPEYVNEVVDIYNQILDPQENDKLMLTQALDHILEHLALIIKTYKQRKSDDLEIYRNFLGMRFNLKGIFS